MRKIVFILCFFCTINILTGQENQKTFQNKDSLNYYYDLANHPKTPLDLAKAYKYYSERKQINREKNDTLSTIKDLRQVAILQFELGDYSGSESSSVEALRFLDAMKQTKSTKESKAGLYNELGRIYKERLDYNIAIKYFKRGLQLAETPASRNIIKNNMALVYNKQKRYDLSEKLLSEVYNSSIKLGDTIQAARALDNLGFVEGKLNRQDGLQHMEKALRMLLSKSDKLGTYSSYKHFSEYYKALGDFERAEFFAIKAYNISKDIKSASYLEDALGNLISIRPNTEVSHYIRLRDSIEKANQIAENKYALIKFDYEKQEKIAIENKIQKEKKATATRLFQAIGIILIVFSVLIINMLYSKNQRDKLQEIYITETRISKKLHDEVANDVFHVMTKLENPTIDKNIILNELEDIYLRTRDISKENSTIALNENFEEVLKDMLLHYNTKNVKVFARNISKIDWEVLDPFKKVTLYRVLQELMVNMKKHSKATIVALTFSSKGKKISINYSDNGVGSELKKLSGLQNVENRMASFNGTAIFESKPGQGFKAKISI